MATPSQAHSSRVEKANAYELVPGWDHVRSQARDINDSGQIVGASSGGTNGQWAFRHGGSGPLTGADALAQFPGLLALFGSGSADAVAFAVNASGQTVGSALTTNCFSTGGPPECKRHAFLSGPKAGLTDLGTLSFTRDSIAYAVNNAGQIVGTSGYSEGGTRAVLWTTNGSLLDLGTLGHEGPAEGWSEAYGINASGQVVGSSSGTNFTQSHAFMYSAGTMIDLSVMPGGSAAFTAAHAINDAGQVVGGDSGAFLYSGGRVYNLQELIPKDPQGNPEWALGPALAINNAGQILCNADFRVCSPCFPQHALLLTPAPVADMAVSAVAWPAPVGVGGDLVYTFTVANRGPSAATGVRLTDVYTDTAAFVSATPSPGAVLQPGNYPLLCVISNLPVGGSATLTVVVRPTAAGMLTNFATVTANESDPEAGNDTATLITLASTTPSIATPSGLVAWWPADGDAQDRVGTNHGVLVGGAGYAPGIVGEAFSFDGATGYAQIPDGDLWAFGTNDFTVELWVNWRALNPGTLGRPATVFVGHDEAAFNNRKWFFAYGGGVLSFHVNGPGIGPWFLAQAPLAPETNQWYHVAVTRTALTFRIYANGLEVASESNPVVIPNASAPLTIGQAEDLGYLDGLVDEVAVYRRALSGSELQAIYNAGPGGRILAPRLRITRWDSAIALQWPAAASGFVLEATPSLSAAAWALVANPVQVIGDQNTVTDGFSDFTRFYRLRR